jgi:hypothetical protein
LPLPGFTLEDFVVDEDPAKSPSAPATRG